MLRFLPIIELVEYMAQRLIIREACNTCMLGKHTRLLSSRIEHNLDRFYHDVSRSTAITHRTLSVHT